MRRNQYYVQDENDTAALVSAYSYLIRRDCRWLANLPGIDRKRLQATYQAQQRGEVWSIQDMIEMARKPVIAFPTTAAPTALEQAA